MSTSLSENKSDRSWNLCLRLLMLRWEIITLFRQRFLTKRRSWKISSSSDREADKDKDTSGVGVKPRMSSTSAKGRLPIEHLLHRKSTFSPELHSSWYNVGVIDLAQSKCVHWSQLSHDNALLRAVTPLPQWVHECLWVYCLLTSAGAGFLLTSPPLIIKRRRTNGDVEITNATGSRRLWNGVCMWNVCQWWRRIRNVHYWHGIGFPSMQSCKEIVQ